MSKVKKLPASQLQRTHEFETALSRVGRDRPSLQLRLQPESVEYKKLVELVEEEADRNRKAAKRAEGLARLIDGQTEEEIVIDMDVSRSTVRGWTRKLDTVQRKLERGMPVRSIRYEFDL